VLDYLITNARLLDPESGGDFSGSLGIAGGSIEGLYLASAPLPAARRVIDLEGRMLVPGFIDVHCHSDNEFHCAEKLLAQGITTALSGNCGFSPTDFSGFFSETARRGYPVNQAELAGHGSLRALAGQEDVYAAASPPVLDKLKGLIHKAFDQGAAGLSFGLEYVPGAPPEEVLELAELAAAAGKITAIHTRVQRLNDVEGFREALEMAKHTKGRLIISHLVYMLTGEELRQGLDLIAAYRREGVDVWADSGVYTAFATSAGSPVFDEKVFFEWGMTFDRLHAATGKYAGQTLDREKYREIRRDSVHETLIYEAGSPEDITMAYALADVMVSTDAGKSPPGQGHPQGAATFPRFFRTVLREQRQLSLMEGLRRCTLIPAQALGLHKKGRLSPGADADLVALDWDRLEETADFLGFGSPGTPPRGISHVFVGGRLVIEKEKRVPGVYAGGNVFLPVIAPGASGQ
jgi:N-acyl-D-amino-acid deacylase